MKVIGLIGGIASGKSAVAAELQKLGATVLDADKAAHQVINQPIVQQTLTSRWGKEILLPSGEIDRSAIAERVFSGDAAAAENLQFLEDTLHPVIRKEFEQKIAKLANSGTKVVIIDAPLLLEAGWGKLCDAVVFVDSSRENRLQRALDRNWTEAQFAHREAAQMPIEEKRRQATHVLLNEKSLEELKSSVHALWESLPLD